MLIVQILLGGITRLTGSGLSITEWKPLLGALPPLNQKAWQESFYKYQQIAQFKKLNSHFALADYKTIFFWEWLHREWARLMGLVFLVPFIWFIIRKQIGRGMICRMIILFLLGGFQGAIGWIMVQSGLNDMDVTVNHIRLAVHFMCALLLLGYLLWFILKLRIPSNKVTDTPHLKTLTLIILALLCCQLTYGAFMAGLHAALYAPTWPDINGVYVPNEISNLNDGLINNMVYNPLGVQFVHRSLAYLIGLLTILWFIKAQSVPSQLWFKPFKWIPLLLIFAQIAMGIVTLLNSASHQAIYYAVAHQLIGILTLLAFLVCFFLTKGRNHLPTLI